MNIYSVALGLIGGLGIFLYGMHYMSDGLQRIAGSRLKNLLAVLTSNRFFAVGMGVLITALIQSSSATTVTIVGFVNAGLMTLTQAIGVVLGANIGTTVTAWIIGIKITKIAPLLIGIGCFMVIFLSSQKWNRIGQVILGFGFLFFGMTVMKEGVEPLKKSEFVLDIFHKFSTNPLLAIAAGIVMTCLLQSSSATIGLAIVLAQQGLIDLDGAIPLIIGDNIGTTITAQLAALKTSVNARRTAMSHTLFNVLGAAWIIPLIYLGIYQKFIVHITPIAQTPDNSGIFIANAHTCFNLANVVLFIPLIGLLEKVSCKLVREKDEKPSQVKFRYLEPHFADNPALAIEMVRREIAHMLEVSRKAVDVSVEGILSDPPRPVADAVGEVENFVDEMQFEITRYIVSLSQGDLDQAESDQIPVLLHSVNDIERISDHALNIAQASEHLDRKHISLSDDEKREIIEVEEDLSAMFAILSNEMTSGHGDTEDSLAHVFELEQKIDKAKRRSRKTHINRLKNGETGYSEGMVFLDTINNFEKIGDHLTNLTEAILRSFQFSKKSLHNIQSDKSAVAEQPNVS